MQVLGQLLANKSVCLQCFAFLCAGPLHHGVQHPLEWQIHVALSTQTNDVWI